MGRTPNAVLLVFCGLLVLASAVMAQDVEFQAEASPYQGEFAYQMGTDLAPGVAINGIRWTLFRIEAKNTVQERRGKDVTTLVFMDFQNPTETTVRAQVFVLLEDGLGNILHRIELDSVRIPWDATKNEKQKVKVPDDAILDTTKIYLYCEIE